MLTFWGRRGKKLSTKMDADSYSIWKLIDAKKRKGYKEINAGQLAEVYPEFEDDLSKTVFWAILKA